MPAITARRIIQYLKKKSKKLVWFNYATLKLNYQSLLGPIGFHRMLAIIEGSTSKSHALQQLAVYFANAGLPDHSIEFFEKFLALEPNSPYIHQYLQTLMYSSPEKYSHEYVYNAHIKWGNTLNNQKKFITHANKLTKNRRLKIGYTCHFITNSTSTTLLLPILKAHNKDRVEIFMYSDQDPNETTDEVRCFADHWRDTRDFNNDAFCEQVQKDKIDILLELNGHCAQNRYRELARKPAPIQVNYYNYSSTCGVPGIDYILVGENFDIDHLQPYYSEKIIHKKGVYLGTIVSPYFPPVSPPPFLKNGYITFGSFGQAHKISREQIFLWCDVLKRVPNSRFYMKAGALDCPITLNIFKKHFSDSGIDTSRILLEGSSEYTVLLESYAKVDIGLDSYPFAGGTTTAEATIQGVPVIALMGDRFCSKHGWINLHPLKHDELLCYSKNEFINKAVALASNHQRLMHYRKTLRDDFIHSPRGDMVNFIKDLEDVYDTMWENYLNVKQPHLNWSLAIF